MLRYLMSGEVDWAFMVAWLLAVTIAITVHEFAHAKRAEIAGDRTPRLNGRVTLNPLAHYDPVGSTMFLLFGLGWAKPVPINPVAFRRPRRDTLEVSLWGPLSNFIVASLFAIPIRLGIPGEWALVVYLNLALGVFNLIPIPPLDGSHVLEMLLPLRAHQRWELFWARNRQWVFIILMVVLFFGPLNRIVFGAIQVPIVLLFRLLTGMWRI